MSYTLVTAGGTSVPIDAVRRLANDSKGGFGCAFVKALREQDPDREVVLLCTRLAFEISLRGRAPDGVCVYFFDTFDQYVEALDEILLTHGRPGMVFLSAAVSDFSVVSHEGKMASGKARSLTLEPLPKVIDTLRKRVGHAYLVGFKFLAGDTPVHDLVAQARNQNARAHLNLTVANLQEGGAREHKRVWLVKPDGGVLPMSGAFEAVAREVVGFCLRQRNTRWMVSTHTGRVDDELHERPSFAFADRLLRFAIDAGLLHGSPGNVMVVERRPTDEEGIPEGIECWTTPRAHPKKEALTGQDLVWARPLYSLGHTLLYRSAEPTIKPSIDTAVYGRVLSLLPAGDHPGVIHFHGGWVLGDVATTTFDYPCGTQEEAGEILAAIERSGQSLEEWFDHGITLRQPLMVHLLRHGHSVIIPTHDELADLEARWSQAKREYLDHLKEIGVRRSQLRLQPLWHQARIVGVAASHKKQGWFSFFLREGERGSGMGYELCRLIDERGACVAVHRDCEVEAFYRRHEFAVVEMGADGVTILQPPSVRRDLIDCATAVIYSKSTDSFLLGKRMAPPNEGQWVNLGGHVSLDPVTAKLETPWRTCVREVLEEGAVDLCFLSQRPPPYRVFYVEGERGKTCRVFCYQVELPGPIWAQADGQEMEEVRWVKANDLQTVDRPPATRESHKLFLRDRH